MQNDSDWLLQQVRSWAGLNAAELLAGLGTPATGDAQDPDLHVLVPHNPRLRRAVVRTVEGRVLRVGLEGPPFAVPLPVVATLTKAFRRTFNTYDPIDDEQFFFYPAHAGLPFVALESWVAPARQRADAQQVLLGELLFHFGTDEIPFHFRDGWHLAPRPSRTAPTPPIGTVGTALRRLFRRK
jgi:hypothetical protein